MIQNNTLSIYSDTVYLVGLFVFILGAAMGSFINVVVDRLIKGQGLGGRSHCDHCKKTLSWFELFPIFSYFFLKGKCGTCHVKLSIEHPLIEIFTGILYVCVWLVAPFPLLIPYWGIVSCAWIIMLSDIRYKLISDYMQIALFISVVLTKLIGRASIFSLLADGLSGVLVALPIGLIYVVSNERAMGLGDVILASIIGFTLGTGKGLLSIYISFLIGAIAGVYLLITRKKGMKSTLPFGPFLLIGMLIAALWGNELIQIVKGMYGI